MKADAEFELELRQRLLLARSDALRATVATQGRALVAPFATADRARAAARWLYARRVWFGAGAAVVLVVRPRRAWRIAGRGWRLWRSVRRARAWLGIAGLLARRV